jgi:hypothetical protein
MANEEIRTVTAVAMDSGRATPAAFLVLEPMAPAVPEAAVAVPVPLLPLPLEVVVAPLPSPELVVFSKAPKPIRPFSAS